MEHFHYVDILVSESEPERHYTGLTDDLGKRLTAITQGNALTQQSIARGELKQPLRFSLARKPPNLSITSNPIRGAHSRQSISEHRFFKTQSKRKGKLNQFCFQSQCRDLGPGVKLG